MQNSLAVSPTGGIRQQFIGAGALLVILASAFWIHWREFGSPNLNVPLHRAVGEVMAEETAHVVGRAGKVFLVIVDTRQAPELKIQLEAFKKQLKLLSGIVIQTTLVLDPDHHPKYRTGSGLSAKRFLKIVQKNPGVDAVVSFVGAPYLSEQDLAQLKSGLKLIAEARSPERLTNLLQKKVLLAAIVPRFDFPAPGPRKPQTDRQWFDRYFQVLSPDTPLPKPDDSP